MPVRQARRFVEKALARDTQDTDRAEKPMIVAFDTSDGFSDGTELMLDQFYHVLEDYDAVIVQWTEGDHPSQPDHYLLYRGAKQIDLADVDIVEARQRSRSTEIIGDFSWFKHGQSLPVKMAIGLRCRHTPTWNNLP